jgi:hypothetical protein
MIYLIKSKCLFIISDFERNLTLIIVHELFRACYFELIVIERSDSDKHFKTIIGVVRLIFID